MTDIDKQCRPRPEATERAVWSGPTLFALNKWDSIKYSNDKNDYFEMDRTKKLRRKRPFGINGLILTFKIRKKCYRMYKQLLNFAI